jgi:hypothetical protein
MTGMADFDNTARISVQDFVEGTIMGQKLDAKSSFSEKHKAKRRMQ